ncbi:hypothetical protein ACPOL_6788 (plasmid) [Acidisarcina polymorpha]|uniref:Uncharacterized protein n=2 Tax=Acidisarcina polymorpha TaxID=2211140 RepID=A0A2Z5GAG9_9BACT|nr:hypothetical protein ACPOL_6788 [Acidisarcina polymorpha]
MAGFDELSPRPEKDEETTPALLSAGPELSSNTRVSSNQKLTRRIDGRKLRSRGANIQMNIKVTAEEKEMILREASKHIQDLSTGIKNIGEFVVRAVENYRATERC